MDKISFLMTLLPDMGMIAAIPFELAMQPVHWLPVRLPVGLHSKQWQTA
jgi:hypothetical protein